MSQFSRSQWQKAKITEHPWGAFPRPGSRGDPFSTHLMSDGHGDGEPRPDAGLGPNAVIQGRSARGHNGRCQRSASTRHPQGKDATTTTGRRVDDKHRAGGEVDPDRQPQLPSLELMSCSSSFFGPFPAFQSTSQRECNLTSLLWLAFLSISAALFQNPW